MTLPQVKGSLRRHIASGTVAGVLCLLAVIIFNGLCNERNVMLSTDDNIGALAVVKQSMPLNFFGTWSDSALMGSGGGLLQPAWINFWLWVFPVRGFMNGIHALDMLVGSAFLILFLRRFKLSMLAVLVASIICFWIGSNLTLIYPGHIPKFGILMFAPVILWCITRCVESKKWVWAIVAGGSVGLMFLEQMDVALFFGIFLGAYAVFKVCRMTDVSWARRVGLYLAPMGLMALWVAGPTLLQGYAQNITGVSQVSDENPQAKWEYVTQWSFPPEEMLALVAPGYVGWRSGEPEGPYWGRMGRSAEWESTRHGFMNFKLDDWYVGVIPVVLSFAAVLFAIFQRTTTEKRLVKSVNESEFVDAQAASDRKAEIFFWGGVTVIALLLSFGKYFPLYAVFYQFPVVNNIRAPVKFLQIAQLGLSILAAYGLDEVLRRRTNGRLVPSCFSV